MSFNIQVTPLSERQAMIKQRRDESNDSGEIIYDFRGDTYKPDRIKLPIDVPVYRMENCRTFSKQQAEVARNDFSKDFFEKGQESTAAQQVQHEILTEMFKGTESVTPITSVLETEGQRESLLITSSGVVVNGNRRLAAMRELYFKEREDGLAEKRFSHVSCDVLPADTNHDEIDDIEADLQARPQTKLEYDWIGDARLVRRQIEKGRSSTEVANRLRRSKRDIENVLQSLEEAELYLSQWINKPGEYDLLLDGQQIFRDLPKAIAKKDDNLQDACRAIAWSIYENRNKVSGRVYHLNPAFGDLAFKVLENLEEALDLNDASEIEVDLDDFAIAIDSEDDTKKNYKAIIEALRNESTKDKTSDILIDVCESTIELEKGLDNEKAPLKTLQNANQKILSIDINSAGFNTLSNILKQIESIRTALVKFETSIQKRQQNEKPNTIG